MRGRDYVVTLTGRDAAGAGEWCRMGVSGDLLADCAIDPLPVLLVGMLGCFDAPSRLRRWSVQWFEVMPEPIGFVHRTWAEVSA